VNKVEKIIENILSGKYDEKKLRSVYINLNNNKDIAEDEKEAIMVLLRKKHWETSPRMARNLFGAEDSEAMIILNRVNEELEKEFDLSGNRLKRGVKIGGDKISGKYHVQNYISYKNKEGMKAELCLQQEGFASELIARVIRQKVSGSKAGKVYQDEFDAMVDEAKYVEAYRNLLTEYCGLIETKSR